jgi:hypothetical protein
VTTGQSPEGSVSNTTAHESCGSGSRRSAGPTVASLMAQLPRVLASLREPKSASDREPQAEVVGRMAAILRPLSSLVDSSGADECGSRQRFCTQVAAALGKLAAALDEASDLLSSDGATTDSALASRIEACVFNAASAFARHELLIERRGGLLVYAEVIQQLGRWVHGLVTRRGSRQSGPHDELAAVLDRIESRTTLEGMTAALVLPSWQAPAWGAAAQFRGTGEYVMSCTGCPHSHSWQGCLIWWQLVDGSCGPWALMPAGMPGASSGVVWTRSCLYDRWREEFTIIKCYRSRWDWLWDLDACDKVKVVTNVEILGRVQRDRVVISQTPPTAIAPILLYESCS